MKRVKKSKNRIFGHFSHISFIISAWNGTFSRRSLSRHLFPLRSLQILFFCDPHDIWELLEPNLESSPPLDFFLYKYLAKGVLWPRPLYRHLALNKAKNRHFGFNFSNSLFYQKSNGIFKISATRGKSPREIV